MTRLLAITLLGVALAGCVAVMSPAQRAALQKQQVALQRQREAKRRAEQVVLECREKRLAGELSGYVASVRCSNDRIREAWAASGYPHMDLVDLQLAYRLAVARRVDAGSLSEQHGQRRVAELTARINAEVRERTATASRANSERPRSYEELLQRLGVWSAATDPPEPDTIRCFQGRELITCD
ncbi:MAG: hypothetical protein HY726_02795 [Candidatus Rokubacteria bacterium]|nr:hypothetical protein [Candidatus Rokubacteria bacterium]